MRICELAIANVRDRKKMVSILTEAGYKVSIDEKRNIGFCCSGNGQFVVVVEDKEAGHD